MIVGLALAVACAIVTSVAFLLKHRGAVLAPDVHVRHPLRSAADLFRSRWFALGWIMALGRLGPPRRCARARTALRRAGRPLGRAGVRRRVRGALLRLPARAPSVDRRDRHRGGAGDHRRDLGLGRRRAAALRRGGLDRSGVRRARGRALRSPRLRPTDESRRRRRACSSAPPRAPSSASLTSRSSSWSTTSPAGCSS